MKMKPIPIWSCANVPKNKLTIIVKIIGYGLVWNAFMKSKNLDRLNRLIIFIYIFLNRWNASRWRCTNTIAWIDMITIIYGCTLIRCQAIWLPPLWWIKKMTLNADHIIHSDLVFFLPLSTQTVLPISKFYFRSEYFRLEYETSAFFSGKNALQLKSISSTSLNRSRAEQSKQ